MSRIGNKAVEIPDKVKVNVGDGGQVSVEGPKGKLQWTLPREIRASQVLTPRTQLIEYKHEERAAEVKREEMRPALEPVAPADAASSAPKAAEIRDLKDQLDMKEPAKT